jgi:hypothetical protein
MPASKAKKLSSLFRSAIKSKAAASTSFSKSLSSPAEDATLKHFVSSLDSDSGNHF